MPALTAIELGFFVKKLDFLLGSRLDNAYIPEKKELLLRFYVSAKGNQTLIITPSSIFLSEKTPESSSEISYFCTLLRKKLRDSRLASIRQIGFERIVELVFSNDLKIVAEIFSKGNIILLDKDNRIIALAETQIWSQRKLKQGEIYQAPKPRPNIFELDDEHLKDLLLGSDRQNLVKALAMDFGMGGIYAEKLCLLAGIDKNKKPSSIDDDDIRMLLDGVKKLQQGDAESSPEQAVYVIEKKPSKFDSEISRMKTVISEQERFIEEGEKEAEENMNKAEFIYQNYEQIKSLLESAKKMPISELKDKLKTVKEVNPKEKSFVVEI